MVDEPPGSRTTMRWEAGSRFGPYLLKRLLGRGGFGEVYEALDTTKNRRVALKMLAPAYSADPGFRKRLFREARSTARLNEAHVVPIHDYGEIDGQLYIDMRLVPGADLASVLAESGPLDPARAVHIVGQIASALDAAHGGQIIHRDVKPANILLAQDDYACLVDFGLANAAGDTKLTSSGTTIGTFAYLAPERLNQSDVGPGADIYALACLLYECVTGSPPYTGDIPALISAHLTAPIPRPSRHHPGIPAGFDDVIAAAMAKNPHDRYSSAGELAAAARQVLAPTPGRRDSETTLPAHRAATLASTGTTPRPTPPGTGAPPVSAPSGPAPNRGRVRTTVVLAVAAVVMVVVAVVGYMLRTPPSPTTTQDSSSSGASAIPTGTASDSVSYGEQIELPFPGLVGPNDVAVDITGAVYVTNTFKNAVLKLTPHAGAPVELPFTGLFNPEGLAADGAGGVYVADSVNQRVVYLAAGADRATVLPFTGLGYPHGVAVKILDRTVYAVAHEPSQVLKLAWGASASVPLPFTGLQETVKVALDAADEIYVVDKLGNRVIKLRADDTQVELPFTGLSWPEGLAVDNAGTVYVADTLHDRVLKLAAGGTTPIELPFTGLHSPAGVAVDGDRNVYVTDSPDGGAGRVVKLPVQ